MAIFTYGIKNTYRPTWLAPRAYGWGTAPSYHTADVPTALMDRPGNLTADQFQQQFAYEWFQSEQVGAGLTNPPFLSGAAGRLHPLLRDAEGAPARILRGYIRRAEWTAGDSLSRARLYFMFNPEQITRDYVNYLDQAALDPFNTVFDSKNMVAPPSILDFTFSLFFDRQEEAMQKDHPGVFVDYQFFDMVVRNVVPTDPNQTSNTLPDNGIMMVNPRAITVVFSPQISVKGFPLNARVSFEKFTHRMTPTRMTIDLTVRAVYFGPVQEIQYTTVEDVQAEDQIPIDAVAASVFDFSKFLVDSASKGSKIDTTGSDPAMALVNFLGQVGNADAGNQTVREQALKWATDNVVQFGNNSTKYWTSQNGPGRYNLPTSADCSGLVTAAYVGIGKAQDLNWQDHPSTSVMMSRASASSSKGKMVFTPLSSINWQQDLLPGDVLIRDGHTAFFMGYQGGGHTSYNVFEAAGPGITPQVGQHTNSGVGKWTHLIRPTPVGSLGSAAQGIDYNNPDSVRTGPH